MSAVDKRAKFESALPVFVDEIVNYLKTINIPDDVTEWYKNVCECRVTIFSNVNECF